MAAARSKAQPQQQAGAADFRGIAEELFPELIDALDKEHIREVNELYEEQVQIREELKRVVELMTTEVLPREKSMHDMIEKLHEAHEAATAHLHANMAKHLEKGTGHDEEKRKDLLDPMQAMEEELKRIATLLGHEVVRPDIAGWQAPGASSRSPAKTPSSAKSPKAPSPRGFGRMMEGQSLGGRR